jgi:hypothetical protein
VVGSTGTNIPRTANATQSVPQAIKRTLINFFTSIYLIFGNG